MTPSHLPALVLACALLVPAGLHAQDKDKVDFAAQIRPILEARCFECHGPEEQEADVRFDLRSSVFHEGGVDEWIIVPGNAEKSEFYARIVLPADDPDVMPNEGELLTKKQIGLIRDWINQGAEWPEDGAAPVTAPVVEVIALAELGEAEMAARQKAIDAIRKRGALALQVAADTMAVDVNFSLAGGDVADADLALLDGLESTLVWLNLSRTKVTDRGLERLAKYPQLRRLNLARTSTDDGALRHVAGLEHLEYLNLYGTAVTDAGLAQLRGLAKLRKLYLWQSKVTEDGAARLAEALPEVEIDLGRYAEGIMEVARARTPVNAKCPVADKPVKPAYVFSFEGANHRILLREVPRQVLGGAGEVRGQDRGRRRRRGEDEESREGREEEVTPEGRATCRSSRPRRRTSRSTSPNTVARCRTACRR